MRADTESRSVMPRVEDVYDNGVGEVGPIPRPLSVTGDDPADATELSEAIPGSRFCPHCGDAVPPPAIACPDDGAQLAPDRSRRFANDPAAGRDI